MTWLEFLNSVPDSARLVWLAKRFLLGQGVSLAVSATGVFTTLLVNSNRSFPVLQSATAYLWIAAVYLPSYLFILNQRHKISPNFGAYADFVPLDKLWRYLLLAVVDLEANYVVVKAYQYTNMTSVQLLDCCTIPFVMVLSVAVLSSRYSRPQILGAGVALLGLALLIVLDADGLSRTSSAPNPIVGDLLCVLSSALYATSNVGCEKLVKVDAQKSVDHYVADAATLRELRRSESSSTEVASIVVVDEPTDDGSLAHAALTSEDGTSRETRRDVDTLLPKVEPWMPVMEYLACMSTCGVALACVQFFATEYSGWALSVEDGWSSDEIWYHMMFGASMLLVYTGMPVLFLFSSATFANLSLLTADVYSIIWNVAVFGIAPKWEFALAYLIIVLGIACFDTKGFKGVRRWLRYPTTTSEDVAH